MAHFVCIHDGSKRAQKMSTRADKNKAYFHPTEQKLMMLPVAVLSEGEAKASFNKITQLNLH